MISSVYAQTGELLTTKNTLARPVRDVLVALRQPRLQSFLNQAEIDRARADPLRNRAA
jgi:hypothetical protein